jgi:hypothetical protein
MHRFRSSWMALMAGAFLVTLSVSAAFGAAPAATRDATRGQTIASLVHELIFGTDETQGDEELVEEEDELDEEELDENLEEDELVEADPLDDELDEDLDEETDAHGACVAEVAQDPEAIGGPNENHGGAVSEAARVTCWETDESDEVSEELVEEEDELVEEEEESDSHGACVSAAAQDRDGSAESELKNHGKWVSQHARYTCWGLEVPTDDPDEDATDEEDSSEADGTSTETDEVAGKPNKATKADKAARGNGKPSWAGNGGNGNGNGRGGGRR